MRRLATLLLCAAALIAGCGSDDEHSAPAAKGTPTPSQQQDRGGYDY
jgi:major membrane immunogen (membrane-anchored lipoprotein)